METDVLIVTNGRVLTCDAANRGGRYTLVIRGGRIEEVCESAERCAEKHPGARVIDASDRLIVPGFVNAHFHSHSIVLRSITDGLHFAAWKHNERLREVSAKLLDAHGSGILEAIYGMAYAGHIVSGTTCVGEFPPAYEPRELDGVLAFLRRTAVKSAVALQTWDHLGYVRERPDDGTRFSVSLGREEDYTVYSFETLVRAAREMKLPITAHIAEQKEDADILRRNFQKDAMSVLRDYNILRFDTGIVHLNHLGEPDIALIEDVGATATLCPRSAAEKRTGYPVLKHLAAHDVRLCLGTDWGEADMLREMRFLSSLPLLLPGLPSFSPLELVRMATINGAFALGYSREIGSIEAGKKADMVFLSLDDLRLQALPDPVDAESLASLLVEHLSSRDITDVMIDGVLCMERGVLRSLSSAQVVAAFRIVYDTFHTGAAPKDLPADDSPARRDGAPARSKIIPFVARERVPGPAPEGFEEGFPEAGNEPASGNEPAPGANLKQPAPPRPVEPPSRQSPGTRTGPVRTFGEDEDFTP